MKLFIILMSFSTLGFGVAASVLHILERRYEETLRIEKGAFERLQRETHDPDNKQYHRSTKAQAGTTGRELPEYLSACARLAGITGNIEGTDNKTERRRDYFESRATYRLKGITLPDLVRFLARVEGKGDIYLKSLHISKIDYGSDPRTCNAQAMFYVFSEKE
jgi:hypothetical protein